MWIESSKRVAVSDAVAGAVGTTRSHSAMVDLMIALMPTMASLTLHLSPGRYSVVCNKVALYESGMSANFEVSKG